MKSMTMKPCMVRRLTTIRPGTPRGPVADGAAFHARLIAAIRGHDILRVKGFVDIKGKPMRLLVQGVGARIQHQFDKRWPDGAPRQGRLVVIGETGLDKTAIRSLILG